jgi:hypothetical protein
LKAEDFSEQRLDIDGWPIRLTSWRLGAVWHCHADNVSPGSTLARVHGHSKQDVERQATQRASELLGRTRREAV